MNSEQRAERLLSLLAERDRGLFAFMPEPDRRERLIAAFEDASDGPLAGVAVGVKDVFAARGMLVRGGSALPPELFAERLGTGDAPSVARLVAAGAVVLGKTVTTEFAAMEPNATRNPHNRAHTPGGSSSGSAAAVAAGICPLALGTQTVGSVIRPAAYCGVLGFKPSLGGIDTSGVLPFSLSVDHVGVFAESMQHLATALTVLMDDFRAAPRRDAVRLLVPVGAYLMQVEPLAREAFERTLATLEAGGVELRRVNVMDDIADIARRHYDLIYREFALEHARWFADWAPLYRPASAHMAVAGSELGDEVIDVGRRSGLELREHLGACLAEHGGDAWVMPAATGPAPRGLGHTGDPAMSTPWTHAGMPAIALPAGEIDGLPLGLQLAAAFGADADLLAVARRIEAVLAGSTDG